MEVDPNANAIIALNVPIIYNDGVFKAFYNISKDVLNIFPTCLMQRSLNMTHVSFISHQGLDFFFFLFSTKTEVGILSLRKPVA